MLSLSLAHANLAVQPLQSPEVLLANLHNILKGVSSAEQLLKGFLPLPTGRYPGSCVLLFSFTMTTYSVADSAFK